MVGASIGAADFAKTRRANSIKIWKIIGEFFAFLRLYYMDSAVFPAVYRRRCFPRRMNLIGPLTWLQFRLL